MSHNITIALLASLSLLGACSKKDGGSASGKSAEGAKVATKLPKLGLQLDIPGEALLADGIGGDKATMLSGPGIGGMQVDIPKAPQTVEEAKSDASMYNPKNLKTETLPDGYVITFENTGSMGTNYWVQVRRDIGGKTYECSTTGSEAAQAKAVVEACKSLRP
ncbi:MAG: uncharacterized protein JWO36_6169 [Myxococcales bacterium]|nr:uncharacterized protein [Myxococcales bacterium]